MVQSECQQQRNLISFPSLFPVLKYAYAPGICNAMEIITNIMYNKKTLWHAEAPSQGVQILVICEESSSSLCFKEVHK